MSSMPRNSRLSHCWLASLLAILLPCGIAAAQCVNPFDFEGPGYVGTAAGTLTTGQSAGCAVADQWYLPVAGSLDHSIYTYVGNTLGISPNPLGGLQFDGALGGPARAQHSQNFGTGGVWKVELDCTGRWALPTGPAVNNLGSFSLQPSATTKYFQQLMNWGGTGTFSGLNSPPPDNLATFQNFHIHWGIFKAEAPTAITFEVPGPQWLNLDTTHWYHITAIWDFDAAQMLRVSIKDITANGPTTTNDVYSLGWYLQGGPHSTLPIPTDFRLFAGGGNDITGWDNVAFTQVDTSTLGSCCDIITGLCGFSFPEGCNDATHVFGGLGSNCTSTPCVAATGACCDAAGNCTVTTYAACAGGQLWRGVDSACTLCVADCAPAPAAACQSRGNINAYASNNTTSVTAENFIPTQNTITGGCVSGAYTTTFPPLPTSHFRVKYYNNGATGLPGTLLASFEEGVNLTVTGPAATGDSLPAPGSQPVLSWKFAHASVTVTPGVCYWISVTNETTQAWFWDTSGDGEGYFVQDLTPATPFAAADIVGVSGVNLAFCLDNVAHNQTLNLANLTGCVVGSCCFNNCPFTCLSNMSQSACNAAATAAGGTAAWTPGGSCLTACGSAPVFCCRGDFSGDYTLSGKDIQGYVQAMLAPPACAGDSATYCKLNVNEDFLNSAGAVPNPNDIQAFVALLLAGGESPDRICGAIPVASNSSTLVNNSTATTSVFDPDFLCNGAGFKGEGSLWLKFVATHATAIVDTENSPVVIPPQALIDSVLAVYHSTDGGPASALLSQIGCDDDGGVTGNGLSSLINLTDLTIGDTYYIELVAYPGEDASGIYRVNVTSP